ncbi:putative 4-hydroxybenzoate polyprenyltransferase [soil metagenome]
MIGNFLTFIRFSHTIFALPFALGAMIVAANGLPSARIFFLIILAMVFARTAAMTFNRLADWEIDKRNPRTAGRQKLVSRPFAIIACVLSSALFLATAWWINPLCFELSPIALFIIFFYSFTKRFTSAAQFFLGLALAVAPVGAWLAVTGSFAAAPLALAAAVLCWVAGFDMIYATQDYEVDRREGLRSMVVWLGIPRSLVAATALHAVALAGFLLFGYLAQLGVIYYSALALVLAALIFEHLLARKGNLAAINQAFFQANAAVSAIFVLSILVDRLASR